jgi:cobalamin-dependent methionine synthase I
LPKCHTVVGLSNVSFGLKPAARVVLNSAFLHELREAGLTGAIVHASKILPKNRIPEEQWNAALDLIYDRRREGFDPLTHFIGLFPEGTERGLNTRALPVVWSDRAGFERAAGNLAGAARRMATAAATDNRPEFAKANLETVAACSTCHMAYRGARIKP